MFCKQYKWKVVFGNFIFIEHFSCKRFVQLDIVGNQTKGQSSKRGHKKTKPTKFSEKQTFLTPRYAHVRVRIRG